MRDLSLRTALRTVEAGWGRTNSVVRYLQRYFNDLDDVLLHRFVTSTALIYPGRVQQYGLFPEGENMIVKNSFGSKFSGTLDKMTAVQRNGTNFLRTHVVPHNPRSPLQQRNRNHFAEGVETWRSMREPQKRFYRRIANKTPGYNLFLKRWMNAHVEGEEPALPIVLAGTPLDGSEGWFVLRRKARPLFECRLEDSFEIAMTSEDAPYDFILRRGGAEDVITIEDISSLQFPVILEALGLEVQLDLLEHTSR